MCNLICAASATAILVGSLFGMTAGFALANGFPFSGALLVVCAAWAFTCAAVLYDLASDYE